MIFGYPKNGQEIPDENSDPRVQFASAYVNAIDGVGREDFVFMATRLTTLQHLRWIVITWIAFVALPRNNSKL